MRKTADKIKGFLQRHPQAFIADEAYQLASLKYAPDMADVIWEVKRAFERGIAPESSLHGSSTTFFLKDCENIPIAVFKPYPYRSFHELAAYRLDHNHFAGVPQTVITTLEHPLWEGKKTGSCQLFIHSAVTAIELQKLHFDRLSPSSIRRIAAFDLRMLNEDRHTSNLLIVDKETIPIDHEFILPRRLDHIHLAWMEWTQAKTPFSASEKSYIANLDPEEDREILIEQLYLEELLANRHYVASILLKRAASLGLTPYDIGLLMARAWKGRTISSPFEWLLEKIREKNPPNWRQFAQFVHGEVETILTRTSNEKISQ